VCVERSNKDLLCCSGYSSNEAFNDCRLVDLARLIPFGPTGGQNVPRGQNMPQEDSSLPVLNTALCLPDTPMTTDDNASVGDVQPSDDDDSTLVDLQLGVSVPISLAAELTVTEKVTEVDPVLPPPITEVAGRSLAETVTEAEPMLPRTPVDQPQHDLPPGVTPGALYALERLLGMYRILSSVFWFSFVNYIYFVVSPFSSLDFSFYCTVTLIDSLLMMPHVFGRVYHLGM